MERPLWWRRGPWLGSAELQRSASHNELNPQRRVMELQGWSFATQLTLTAPPSPINVLGIHFGIRTEGGVSRGDSRTLFSSSFCLLLAWPWGEGLPQSSTSATVCWRHWTSKASEPAVQLGRNSPDCLLDCLRHSASDRKMTSRAYIWKSLTVLSQKLRNWYYPISHGPHE